MAKHSRQSILQAGSMILMFGTGFLDGAGKSESDADAEDKDHGIEDAEEDGVVGLPQGQVPREGAMAVFTRNKHGNSLSSCKGAFLKKSGS
jgi:hypothetical protein